jgi:DNA-binding winged helix-turn-helix (wHTH) protein
MVFLRGTGGLRIQARRDNRADQDWRSTRRDSTMFILRVSDSQASPSASAQPSAMRQGGRRHFRTFQFGPFLLQPERQRLLKLDAPVRIGGRAFDLLTLLVERAGELVTKQELISRTWPDTFVEEGNLKVNIAGLRRALGECTAGPRFIATVVGRGYRFIAPVDVFAPPLDGEVWTLPSERGPRCEEEREVSAR